MINQVIRSVGRTVITRSAVAKTNSVREAHELTPKGTPLMDLLPVPEGPWEDYHKKQNAKYNIHLITGVLFFAVTFGIAWNGGFFFLNALPPPLPNKKK